MVSLGKKHFNSSISTVYLFLFLLIINQLLTVQSFRLSSNDLEQNEMDDVRRAVLRQLTSDNFANSNELSDDNDLQLSVKPTIQRRFCCMSPLSGRKRSVRDIARKQIKVNQE